MTCLIDICKHYLTIAIFMVGIGFGNSLHAQAWSTPADLSLTAEDADGPQVGANSAGRFVSVWFRPDPMTFVFTIQASSSADGIT